MALVRLLKFFLKYLYIIVIVGTLSVFAGFFAYDNAYLNILVRDGMNERAECILGSYDEETIIYNLTSLFSTDYIYNVYDSEAEKFDGFAAANNYRYSIKVGIAWVAPWSDTCEIIVEERVVELILKYTNAGVKPPAEDYPTWTDGKYKVLCEKKNGVWKIDRVEYYEPLDSAETTDTEA